MKLEILYAKSPQSPFAFFPLKKSEYSRKNLIKSLRKITYEEVKNTYLTPFMTAGSFYDTETGKSIGKLIKDSNVLTNGIELEKGFNLVWEKGAVYIWSNNELNEFYRENNKWPQTSIGGLALILPYIEAREIRPKDNIERTSYGIREDGTVIVIHFIGTIKALQKKLISLGAVKAVQVDSGSHGVCLMKEWIPYLSYGKMKSLIIGIPSFYLYRPETIIRG